MSWPRFEHHLVAGLLLSTVTISLHIKAFERRVVRMDRKCHRATLAGSDIVQFTSIAVE
jgi:hypothetical protein